MDAEEFKDLKEIIKDCIEECIKDNLSVQFRQMSDYGCGGDTHSRLEFKLFYGSQEISTDYITL